MNIDKKYKPIEVETLLSKTWAWHGTGRHQYNNDQSKIIDTLEAILSSGGLNPLIKDPWLKIEGNYQKSISLARIRVYARIYAQTMQYKIEDVKYVYGTSIFWFWIIGMAHVLSNPIGIVSHLLYLQTRKNSSGELDNLISKFHKRSSIKKVPFLLKLLNMPSTDIQGNYGIIFGIADSSNLTFEMDKRYSIFEHRVKSQIPLNRITYIEVPEQNIEETRKILKKYSLKIPVLSLEVVEKFYSKKGFWYCLKNKR